MSSTRLLLVAAAWLAGLGSVSQAAPTAFAGRKPSLAELMEQPAWGRHARSNCVQHWVGDGYCDHMNNNAGCGDYDGGDCCPHTCQAGRAYNCGHAGYSCQTPPAAYPSRGALEDSAEHETGCLSAGVKALRAKALSNMVDYAQLQATKPDPLDRHWGCEVGEYTENDPHTYTIAGRAITVAQPCNTESGLAMDQPLVCNKPAGADLSFEKASAAFAFGTAFFHASGGCVNSKDSRGNAHPGGVEQPKAPHLGDTVPMNMIFAKLLQMLDPNPRFNRVHGKSAQEKADAQMYADSVRDIDAKIDEFWDIVTNQPVSTWDQRLSALDKQIPGMEVSLLAIGTRVAQTCDSFERTVIRAGLEIAAGPAFLAKGYNPDTWRMPVHTAMCDAFLGLVPVALEAFSYQEAIFPDEVVSAIEFLGIASDDTSGSQWSQYWCSTSDHSRYHLLGADLVRKIGDHVGRMNTLVGTKTDVAVWTDGTLCGIGTTCRFCQSPETYWIGKLMTACGEEPKWPAGTRCLGGTTCETMCQDGLGYSWWFGAAGHHCGHEPCWGRGTVCGAGTTCNSCCSGANCPWYQFGICTCH